MENGKKTLKLLYKIIFDLLCLLLVPVPLSQQWEIKKNSYLNLKTLSRFMGLGS